MPLPQEANPQTAPAHVAATHPSIANFANLLAQFASPARKAAPESDPGWDEPGPAEELTTLSYENALRTHARYRPASVPPVSGGISGMDGARESVSEQTAMRGALSGAESAAGPDMESVVGAISKLVSGLASASASDTASDTASQPAPFESLTAQPAAHPSGSSGPFGATRTGIAGWAAEAASAMNSEPAPQSEYDGRQRGPSHPSALHSRKTASVTIRMSEAECDQLHRRATEAGMTISAYLRSCSLEAEALRAQVKTVMAELRAASTAVQVTAEPGAGIPAPAVAPRRARSLLERLMPHTGELRHAYRA